ncbi:MAG: FliH/SctL family protein [Planctomycetota bacterium]|jgi:flagellar biosynthesis/type III secretory pathway protein FliH
MTAVSLQLNMPIQSARVINEETDPSTNQMNPNTGGLSQEPGQVDALCNALQQAAENLERYTEELFLSHKEQIVRLSIEIASKILAKDRHERNYEIEKIILQALQTVPPSKQTLIRLNPDDLKTMRQMSDSNQFTVPEGVHFSGDSSVGLAECIIETDHGVIEYLIEEHLKQVAGVLLQTNDEKKQEK